MAYDGKGTGKQVERGVFTGRSKVSLEDAIRAAVGAIPERTAKTKKKWVVTSITVEVKGDPDVGAFGVTVM